MKNGSQKRGFSIFISKISLYTLMQSKIRGRSFVRNKKYYNFGKETYHFYCVYRAVDLFPVSGKKTSARLMKIFLDVYVTVSNEESARPITKPGIRPSQIPKALQTQESPPASCLPLI